jgi:hypothetical protein
MKHLRRIVAAVATLAGAGLALATTTAASAMRVPPPGEGDSSVVHPPVHVIAGGGMPGWQITLIAVGAALAAAAAAVLLDRAWVTRKTHAPTA